VEQSSLVRLQAEYDVELDWRGFELHPGTPRGGSSLEELFPGRAKALGDHALQVARSFGVASMRVPARMNNTRRVLAVAEWARTQGKLMAFRDVALAAFWERGEDLEDAQVLGRLAEHAGLPAEGARAAMDAPEYQARVDTLAAEGRAAGVSGIPVTFIGNVRVVGCQPYEVFEEAARRAGAKRRA
jgi:predicted DsbA family dithiol-disulfide isomerase